MIDFAHIGNMLSVSFSFELASHLVSSYSSFAPPLFKKALVLTPKPQKLSKVLFPNAKIIQLICSKTFPSVLLTFVTQLQNPYPSSGESPSPQVDNKNMMVPWQLRQYSLAYSLIFDTLTKQSCSQSNYWSLLACVLELQEVVLQIIYTFPRERIVFLLRCYAAPIFCVLLFNYFKFGTEFDQTYNMIAYHTKLQQANRKITSLDLDIFLLKDYQEICIPFCVLQFSQQVFDFQQNYNRIYFILFIGLSIFFMLKQPSSYLYHSPSQQLHHPLFNTHKHNHTTQPYHHEQQSIQTIRALGKLLFQEVIEHEITIDDAYSQYRYQNNNSTKKKMTIYQRAEMKQKKKLEEKMQEEKKLSLKLMQQQNFIKHQKQTPIHHIESNHHHKTILPESKATKNYKLYSPNYQKDQFVQRQLFKKKITEQLQVQNNTTQRQYNNAGEKSYKNPLLIGKESSNMNYLLKSSSKNVQQKAKKKATAQQVDMIFEEVYKKGSEILKRRQSKVLKYRQEKWEQEMQDVTFHPHFYSSQKLRNMTQKDFLERLNNDSKNRESHKILILGEQLKKDSFEPKLNDHINTLSKSKIGSFRQHDTFYEQKSKSFRYSQSNLQKYLSRSQLIEQVSEIVTPEPFNRQTIDGLTAKDLKFLFQ